MPPADRLTIAANTSRFGKNNLTENGSAAPTCGIPIWRLPPPRLLRKNNCARVECSHFARGQSEQLTRSGSIHSDASASSRGIRQKSEQSRMFEHCEVR